MSSAGPSPQQNEPRGVPTGTEKYRATDMSWVTFASQRGPPAPPGGERAQGEVGSAQGKIRTRCPFWLGSPSLFSLEVFCVTHPGFLMDVIHGLNKPLNSSVPWLSGCVWLLVVAALKQMSLKASSAALMDCTLHRAAGLGAVLPQH